HPVRPVRGRQRHPVAAHARRLFGLSVVLRDAEGGGGEHAAPLRPRGRTGRAEPVGPVRLLVIDTALDACTAAVAQDGAVLAALSEPMARGHQERLAPLAQEAMAASGLSFEALDRIGVTVGPGSFTGL